MHLILLLAEELTAVPAMVPSFREREPHGAAWTAVPSFVLHPVVSGGAAGLVAHRPAEHPAPTVAHEDPAVVPAGDTAESPPRGRSSLWPQSPVDVCAGEGSSMNRHRTALSQNAHFHLDPPCIKSCCISEEQRRQSFLVFEIHKWNPHTGRCPGVSGTAPQDNTDETCAPQRWLECGCLGWAPGELATYLETPNAVISAGWALSFRSKAVCMVSLLLNTSCRSQRYPGEEKGNAWLMKQREPMYGRWPLTKGPQTSGCSRTQLWQPLWFLVTAALVIKGPAV